MNVNFLHKSNISGIRPQQSNVQVQFQVICCEYILTLKFFIKLFSYYSLCLCICVCVRVCVCTVNTSLSVLVGTKAVLSCPPVLWTSMLLSTWEIVLRDKLPCFRAFRGDTNETKGGNCTDERITWASRLDENPALQIDPVAITHDGYYRCQMVTPDGNFHRGYHLQVLGKECHILWCFR